jgi:hypothetical protein
MLPIDPGDGPGSHLPGERPLVPDTAPLQAMAHGGTIIRPGAVAWGGARDAGDEAYSSCEAIERTLAAVARNPGELPGLIAELAGSRLWVPLPIRHRPFTDGAAVRLPLIGYLDTEFVPCFTSVQRLTTWVDLAEADAASSMNHAGAMDAAGGGGGGGRSWLRAGDARVVPHIVVPAAGLAKRLPAGLGLALNPDSVPGLPLYPECVPYLARFAAPDSLTMEHLVSGTGVWFLIGHPPAEPMALLAQARGALLEVPAARHAFRAWLSVPGQGEGLVIAVILDDPDCDRVRTAATDAIERAAAAVPLRVPFPLDITFPGESRMGEVPSRPRASAGHFPVAPEPLDAIDAWIARSTRPFYIRDELAVRHGAERFSLLLRKAVRGRK